MSTVKEKFPKNVNEYSLCSPVVSSILSVGSTILEAACWLEPDIDSC